VPTAVIIGGRGQSGRAIGQRLVEDGWDVTATSAGPVPDPSGAPGIRWSVLARDEAGSLTDVVAPGTDVVVDITSFTRAHAEQLVTLGDRVGSAIVISTLSVYSDPAGRSLEEARDEGSFPEWPVPLPEDWPTLAPGDDSYSARKVAVEQLLRERAPWPVTIVRPGAVHGRFSHHLREWYLVKRALDQRPQVVLPFNGESVFQPTATVNLAELVALAAGKPGHRTLNCGDQSPPTVAQISAIIDDLLNWSTERVLVAGPEPRPTVGNHPWAVPRPVVVDMSLAQLELGYQQRASYEEALAETVPWVVEACSGRDWRDVLTVLARYPTELFDYDAEDAYLAARP
jgi:nucleoside-diphosphate-sugar epimerase